MASMAVCRCLFLTSIFISPSHSSVWQLLFSIDSVCMTCELVQVQSTASNKFIMRIWCISFVDIVWNFVKLLSSGFVTSWGMWAVYRQQIPDWCFTARAYPFQLSYTGDTHHCCLLLLRTDCCSFCCSHSQYFFLSLFQSPLFCVRSCCVWFPGLSMTLGQLFTSRISKKALFMQNARPSHSDHNVIYSPHSQTCAQSRIQ